MCVSLVLWSTLQQFPHIYNVSWIHSVVVTTERPRDRFLGKKVVNKQVAKLVET